MAAAAWFDGRHDLQLSHAQRDRAPPRGPVGAGDVRDLQLDSGCGTVRMTARCRAARFSHHSDGERLAHLLPELLGGAAERTPEHHGERAHVGITQVLCDLRGGMAD